MSCSIATHVWSQNEELLMALGLPVVLGRPLDDMPLVALMQLLQQLL